MYHIALYKNGAESCEVGGPVETLSGALLQIEILRRILDAPETEGMVGVQFNKDGVLYGLIITDMWGMPIRDAKTE